MKRHKQTTAYVDESRLFYVAFFSCITVLVSYMYFVSLSVMDVVMRKEIDSQLSVLNSSVSKMEAQYIEIQHSVSSDFATLQGFVVNKDKIFIDRTNNTLLLTRN